MVSTADSEEKAKLPGGNKVSKPLMEKKRRARINQCLDELKFLLENYYSSSIRKRKLEKADILELTVKHLRNLQKMQNCAAASSECPDFRSGFRSCLANFSHFVLAADHANGPLLHLSHRLSRSLKKRAAFSTADSADGPARNLQAALSEKSSTGHADTPGASCIRAKPSQPDAWQAHGSEPILVQNVSSSYKEQDVKVIDVTQSVWRPWQS